MILKIDIIKTLTEWSDKVKEFMINNDKSPIIYGGLFIMGLAVFAIAYGALHRNDD